MPSSKTVLCLGLGTIAQAQLLVFPISEKGDFRSTRVTMYQEDHLLGISVISSSLYNFIGPVLTINLYLPATNPIVEESNLTEYMPLLSIKKIASLPKLEIIVRLSHRKIRLLSWKKRTDLQGQVIVQFIP